MLRALAISLAIVTAFSNSDADDVFTYTASPYQVVTYNQDLIIRFNIRLQGEPYTVNGFRFTPNSKARLIFDDHINKNDLEDQYFEIKTKEAIPRTRSLTMPHLDILTKEVSRDVADFCNRREKALFESALPDEMIISIRSISQNQFLQINPKIVPAPTK